MFVYKGVTCQIFSCFFFKFWLLRSEIREFRFSNSIFYSFLVIGRKTGEIEKHVYFDPFLNICVETGTRGKYNNSHN